MKKPFDFSNIKQEYNDNNLNKFLDIDEINKTKYNRTPVFEVVIDTRRDNFPFIINGELFISDGEPLQI